MQGELVYIQKLLFLTIISFVSMSSMFKSGLRVNLQLQQVTKTIFSLQYEYNLKQVSDENKERYELVDYQLIQY